MEVFEEIRHGGFTFTRNIDPVSREFITQLLEPSPSKRLGANGPEEVKSHKMFRDIDWQQLLLKEGVSPLRGLAN